jgi:hypothetical protein
MTFQPCFLAVEMRERITAKSFLRPEAAGDFLPDLHHAPVALGLIVGEGHSGIVQEAQHVVLAGAETQQKMVRRGGRPRRLPLVGGVASGGWFWWNASPSVTMVS